MADDVLFLFAKILIDNLGFIVSIMISMFMLFILMMIAKVQGPFFKDTLMVAFGLMKDPNIFLVFNASRRLSLEWRPYAALQNAIKNDKTSEIVLVDRTQDFQFGTTNVKKLGFLDELQKKKPLPESVYTEKGTFVDFDNNKSFRTWGYPAHIIAQGTNKTINPIDTIKDKPESRLTSYAVINAIEGWKAYYSNMYENAVLTRGFFLIVMLIIGALIAGNVLLTFSFGSAMGDVVSFFNQHKETIIAGLEELKRNLPHVTPGA